MPLGFNRTFRLDLSILSAALRAYGARTGLSDLDLAKAIGVGGEKGIGYSRWLLACGLRSSKVRKLTDLGTLLVSEDPHLRDPGTKVVLHYQLSSNQYSEVWWFLVNYIGEHREVEADKAVDQLTKAGIGINNRKHLLTDVRLFFDAYLDSECFGPLQILEKTDADMFVARSPSDLPSLMVGYALYVHRETGLQASTSSISNLLMENGQVGKVFFMDRLQLQSKLRELEFRGIVKVSRIADLDNVSYTFDGTALDILKMYYQGRG